MSTEPENQGSDTSRLARVVEQLADETRRLDSLAETRQSENHALLAISELVQEMSRVEDMEGVIRGISERLVEHGFDFVGMTIHRVAEENTDLVESHHLRPDGAYRHWKRPRPDTVEEWRRQRVLYWPDIENAPGRLGPEYHTRSYRSYGLRINALVTVPYRHGTISLRSVSKHAFSDEHREMLTKVGNLLSVGISRLNDFERLDERRAEQEALVAIGRSVLEMRRPEDVESVLRAFSAELRGCGIQVEAVTYHILRNPESQSVETYRILVDGPFTHLNRELPWVWERWRSQEAHYVSRDDSIVHGLHIQSTLYMPHSHGLVTLRSTQPERFEEPVQMLVRRLAEPLSLGFARLNDLEQLARRAFETAQERDFSENLIASLREGLCILSPEGALLDVNPAICEMTGFSSDELIGSAPPHPFWPKDQSRRMRALMLRARRGDLRDYDVTLVRKDGTRFPAVVSPSVTMETKDRGAAYFATIRDVTEQREIQAERVHSQRLRVIGELSAGVSHNLNNILTSILGPAQLLQLKTDDPKLLKDIEMIQFSASRAADLVKRLSWTTAERKEELGAVDLVGTVEQAIKAASPKWRDEAEARGAGIDIQTDLSQVPEIKGTRAGLHDMLLNLIFNAVDAMPGGGRITISADQVDGAVSLCVRDTGVGMSEATRRRVFEPFFTTKMDVGSGLGLSTLFGTIRGWGGTASVESRPDQGSEFTLVFQVWDKTAGPLLRVPREPSLTAITGRALIVDDDPFVGEFLATTLGSQHEIDHRQDAHEGLEAFKAGEFEVVVLDLGMPGMTGDALGREIRKLDNAVALIMITGWDLDQDDPRRRPFDLYLKKPFGSIGSIQQSVSEGILLTRSRREKAPTTDR